MKGHDDAAEDKKLFSKMLKKAIPAKKVTSHLQKDIKEEKKMIREDKGLIRSMRKSKRGC